MVRYLDMNALTVKLYVLKLRETKKKSLSLGISFNNQMEIYIIGVKS